MKNTITGKVVKFLEFNKKAQKKKERCWTKLWSRITTLFDPQKLLEREERKSKEKDISMEHFEFIYQNKIKTKLLEEEKLRFNELNILLKAYEFWRFEKKNQNTFEEINQQTERVSMAIFKSQFKARRSDASLNSVLASNKKCCRGCLKVIDKIIQSSYYDLCSCTIIFI